MPQSLQGRIGMAHDGSVRYGICTGRDRAGKSKERRKAGYCIFDVHVFPPHSIRLYQMYHTVLKEK